MLSLHVTTFSIDIQGINEKIWILITLTLLELHCWPGFPIKLHSLNCWFPCFRLNCEGKNYREEPKAIVFLSKLLLLFQTCHWCFANNPTLSISQSGTMLTIQTSCSHCKRDFTWTSQPLMLGKFPAGNLLLSFAILCSGASINKILVVFKHMGVLVYHFPTYFHHQRHLLIPAVVKYWWGYQAALLQRLQGQEVVLAGDGRHDSMGHSAKYGTYSIFCCTIGYIIHLVLVQVIILHPWLLAYSNSKITYLELWNILKFQAPAT